MPQSVKQWRPIYVCAALGVAAAGALSLLSPATYTASTTLFLGSPASTDSAGAYSGDLFSQQRAATYSALFISNDLATKVIDDLSLSETPDELITKVSATQQPKTVLLDVSVTDESAAQAADIADAYAKNFTEYVERLESPLGQAQPSTLVSVVKEAEIPQSPSSRSPLLTIGVGLLLGLAAGFGLVWLGSKFDGKVRSRQQVTSATDAAILGTVPMGATPRTAMLDVAAETATPYAEALRQLRTNLMHIGGDTPPKTIAFVSPRSTLATTALASDLAMLLAEVEQHVALVDADLRSPRLPAYTGVDSDEGVTTIVSGQSSWWDVMTTLPIENVHVLSGGTAPESASQVLSSKAMARILADLRGSYDFALVDTAGLLAVTDAAVVALACDGVVLVVEKGTTRIDELEDAAETLKNVGARVLGVVEAEAR